MPGNRPEPAPPTAAEGRGLGSGTVTGPASLIRVCGGWPEQQSDQRAEQGFAPPPHVVDELEVPQVQRQLLPLDPPARPEPTPRQGPEAFERVDVDLAEPVPVLIP